MGFEPTTLSLTRRCDDRYATAPIRLFYQAIEYFPTPVKVYIVNAKLKDYGDRMPEVQLGKTISRSGFSVNISEINVVSEATCNGCVYVRNCSRRTTSFAILSLAGTPSRDTASQIQGKAKCCC